ncbi:GMC oxidoreductase-domain-containing protein [Mycena leptocephala]|nr:GMC oxidoreductase-domain-containing protein [Mycena leptocephala]
MSDTNRVGLRLSRGPHSTDYAIQSSPMDEHSTPQTYKESFGGHQYTNMHPQAAVQYDIIFAGGGSTACVVVGRLAAADNTLRILIVENGRSTKEHPVHIRPGRYLENIRTGGETFTYHQAIPRPNLDGHCLRPSNANCVGGGSSVNAMMYTRAAASDYDDWMRLGNPGWGAADLIPLAQKLETYQAGEVNSTHGASGPIKISHGRYETQTGKDFLVSATAFPRGRCFSEDVNDFYTCDVYGKWPKYIDAQTGRRSDTPHNYVYNQSENKNLVILDHARVKRVLFDDKRAVGIEYQVGGKESELLSASASRLVVVSTGTFCSPAILQRSGIGAEEILEKYGIQMVSDLPGVSLIGRGNRSYGGDAVLLGPDDVVTMNSLAHDKEGVFEAQWIRDGTGPLAANGLDYGIKLRANAQDLNQLTPLFARRWETFFANASDKALVFVGCWAASFEATDGPREMYSFPYFSLYPMSTGYVKIRSGDPFAPLEIESGLFDKKEDLLVVRWAYKWSRELARRMESFRGEYAPATRPSRRAVGRRASLRQVVRWTCPRPRSNDEAIDAYHRARAAVEWHALGTCAMKPRDQMGVVDAQLNVYGVKNLKIADLSIAPLNVGANTYNTALIIGEKAAVIIADELGINGV